MTFASKRVAKGPAFSQLNDRFGGTPEHFIPNYQETLSILKGDAETPSLVELARARVDPDDVAHFENLFLQAWWPEAQPIEPIFLAGLIEAIELGLRETLPLDAIWIQANEDEFEIAISQSSAQITLLIITPRAPDPPPDVGYERLGVTYVFRQGNEIVTQGPDAT